MKLLPVFCLLFLLPSFLFAQIIQIGGTQYLNRLDYSVQRSDNGGLMDQQYRSFTRSSQGYTLDLLIWKGFYFNTGFASQITTTGFTASHPDGNNKAGEGLASLWHAKIPIRLKYQQKIFSRWNRSIWTSISIGILYNINRGYNDGFQNGSMPFKSLPANDIHTLYYQYDFNSSLNRGFILYGGDLEIGVDVMPWLAFFFRIGGNISSQTQAIHEITYYFEDTATFQGTMVNTGNTWYYGVGIYTKLFPENDSWKIHLPSKK